MLERTGVAGRAAPASTTSSMLLAKNTRLLANAHSVCNLTLGLCKWTGEVSQCSRLAMGCATHGKLSAKHFELL
jgi:hypothetical protein